jgi:hypothetical protein
VLQLQELVLEDVADVVEEGGRRIGCVWLLGDDAVDNAACVRGGGLDPDRDSAGIFTWFLPERVRDRAT